MSTDSQINSLLRETNQLESQIDAARAQRSDAEARMNKFMRRKEQVQKVKDSFSRTFDDEVSAIQKGQDGTKSGLSRGLAGLKRESILVSAVEGDREKSTESDSFGCQIHSNLQHEINRCQQEIEQARYEMNEADRRATDLGNQRTSKVNQAKSLANNDDATVKVRESSWY